MADMVNSPPRFVTWALERFQAGRWVAVNYNTDKTTMQKQFDAEEQVCGRGTAQFTEVTSENEHQYAGDCCGY